MQDESNFKQEEFCSEKIRGLRLRITNEGVLTNSRILQPGLCIKHRKSLKYQKQVSHLKNEMLFFVKP